MAPLWKSFAFALALVALQQGAWGAVPSNSVRVSAAATRTSGISKEEFHRILTSTISPWVEIAKSKGATLTIDADWERDWVYAAADRKGSDWTIDIKGGMARHPDMTRDGLALIVCHELGHHFGGFPFAHYWVWFSNEGQADYFSTHACARQIWKHDDNEKFREIVDPYARRLCDLAWDDREERNLCYRSSQAGLDLGAFFASLANVRVPPRFETPDESVVRETIYGYPSPQARLDTFFQGALCGARFDLNFVPGENTPQGKMSLEAELEAVPFSCTRTGGYSFGLRPASWFKAHF